ncbi:PREDICTED: uncharacterized protein LOC105364537 [Ceratosolen solmsi marchali]|uniref:Uncharacterized protein LOC105364537 n=1 Tax=Ceratosolen solmsi marchali TaxID=326594 RepID=A0AAJ6YMH0_9HYME|nr:PREDICTED: uncharacterized protein LOC105364537 [Ceratosolen solmsi marchali]
MPVTCCLTPMMVRNAVEELQKKRERVPVSLLISHFQRCLPADRLNDQLKVELTKQADKAVKMGWLLRYSDHTYSLSTLRWQATVEEFGFD